MYAKTSLVGMVSALCFRTTASSSAATALSSINLRDAVKSNVPGLVTASPVCNKVIVGNRLYVFEKERVIFIQKCMNFVIPMKGTYYLKERAKKRLSSGLLNRGARRSSGGKTFAAVLTFIMNVFRSISAARDTFAARARRRFKIQLTTRHAQWT